MRMYPRDFPLSRSLKPKRQAELRTYEALAGIDRQGFAYYEWRRKHESIELDFALWLEGLGRFGLQVKGGHYLLIDGDWYLKKREGPVRAKSCPLDETKLAALDLHDDIAELAKTSYNPYVVPVLVLPDMTKPEETIQSLAGRHGVYIVWGVENLLGDLEGIVSGRAVAGTLPWERIAREVHAVTDGLISIREDEEEACEVTVPSAISPITVKLTVNGVHLVAIRAQRIHCHRQSAAGNLATFIRQGTKPQT